MSQLDFEKGRGLIPVIIQEEGTNEVLMLGFMNREAWEKTQEEGTVWFYSRSKKRLWMKGETTGHILQVRNIAVDCDKDALLIQVSPKGVVCHQGRKNCFQAVEGGKDD
jgi:phosphoribosyl-AMP cyclohydrolase / phosphoribosyl-ATP pyrophosphohydrolase